ncbi:hypothetical protein C8J57DRAFT_1302262 [Mycena rebaudengoi]|nr:hypothetical protein C8J57DRAFT_1302262 [Mycena rebaudengoi]
MVPPQDADDQGQYRIAVALNPNPFVPISYRTSVHRVQAEDHQEWFIGEFELSLNHYPNDRQHNDQCPLFINNSPNHWTWRWDEIGLRWDCRSTLEDGSPMCICYTISTTTQLATFVPPPLDVPPPLPEPVLTVFPDGHECFDHILFSALIIERKLGLDF